MLVYSGTSLQIGRTVPDEIRRQVYRRLAAVLRGENETGQDERLTVDNRAAILEILRDTKPEFAICLSGSG